MIRFTSIFNLILLTLLISTNLFYLVSGDEEEDDDILYDTSSSTSQSSTFTSNEDIWWFWDTWAWTIIKWTTLVLLIVAVILGIMMYRGYQKVKPNILKGIPSFPIPIWNRLLLTGLYIPCRVSSSRLQTS